MKKWTSLSAVNEDSRWLMMSEALAAAGAKNEYVPWTGANDGHIDVGALAQFDHVRVSSRLAPDLVRQVKVQSSWTTLLGVVDGMNRTEHGWWPLCALYESFGQELIQLGQDLDMRGNVLVAGAGGAARVAIAAFFKAGFQNFIVTNFEDAEAQTLVQDIRSRFFGLKVEWVGVEKIVLLPGESAVLVNCTPSLENNALLTELSYLNFLKRPGVLFDMSRTPKSNALVVEAKDAGVRVITGVDLAARTDVLWAKWGFQVELDLATYQPKLAAALLIPS